MITGVLASAIAAPRLFASENRMSDFEETGAFEVFDCHLHCPPESGEKWQWYKVTKSFEDFNCYLEKTGVQRGIINSQRSYATTPAEFIAGNREVARYVEKYKGRFFGAWCG